MMVPKETAARAQQRPAGRDSAEDYLGLWDESYERLDEYLEYLKEKERNHGHGK